MKLELIVRILIILFIIIILIYLDINKGYEHLNVIFKYTGNIITLFIFISIILYKNKSKSGANDSISINNSDIISNPYGTLENKKYEDISTDTLIKILKDGINNKIKIIEQEIKELKKEIKKNQLINPSLNHNNFNNLRNKENEIEKLKKELERFVPKGIYNKLKYLLGLAKERENNKLYGQFSSFDDSHLYGQF